jgi:hypothetical protein
MRISDPRWFCGAVFVALASVLALSCLAQAPASTAPAYAGEPFHDELYAGGPQAIPGKVQCAYYDLGGEGIAPITTPTL